MILKKLTYCFFFLALYANAFAQGEYNNWVYGDSIWLNFNNTPASVSLANINSSSGGLTPLSSSISDAQGNLVAFSSGKSLFDANQQVLLNNMHLSSSGYNVALGGGPGQHLVPFPCNDSLFYFFYYTNAKEIRYGILNKHLNNGATGVVSMDSLLHPNTMGGMALTRHSNNRDLWLTYPLYDSNVYASHRISPDSIHAPEYSQVNTWSIDTGIIGNIVPAVFMEYSPNASKLIVGQYHLDSLTLYDFDNSLGVLSNEITLALPNLGVPSIRVTFSEFSPNSNVLYHCLSGNLIQYDLSLATNAQIANSAKIIHQTATPLGPTSNLDISTTPDGRMITAKGQQPYFGQILSPNDTGLACNYVDSAWYIGRVTGYNLPTIIPNLFVHRTVLSDSLLCQYDPINLYLSDTNFIDSLVWNFGDTASAQNTSTDVVPIHTYNNYGTYPIEVIIYSGCKTDTVYDTLRINPTPIAILPNDTILCEGDSLALAFNDTSFNYLWNTGDTALQLEVTQADTYWVAVSSVCGVDADSIVIDSIIPALVHLPNDTLLCTGDSLLLDATVQNGSYTWSTTDTTPTLWATQPATYWVHSVNACRADSDTIVIAYTHPPAISLGNDTTLCVGDTLFLNAWDTLSTYLWNNGDTSALDTVVALSTLPNQQVISVQTTNLCGMDSDTVEVWFITPPTANLGADTLICTGDSVLLQDTSLFATYAWSGTYGTFSTDSLWYSSNMQSTDSIHLSISNVCGVATDAILLQVDTTPWFNLGADTLMCEGNQIVLDADFPSGYSANTFVWSTGASTASINANVEDSYWASTSNACGTFSDTLLLDVDSVLNIDLGSDTVLCLGSSYALTTADITSPTGQLADNYSWTVLFATGGGTTHQNDSHLISQDQTVQVVASNVCGVYRDTLEVAYDTNPLTYLGPDSTYCITYLQTLDASFSRASYLWSTNETTGQITAGSSGSYSVQVTNLCGYDDDTVNIWYDEPIHFHLGPDTVVCVGDSIELVAIGNNAQWAWNTGSSDSTLWASTAGSYSVAGSNACGTFSDAILISNDSLPVLGSTPQDTLICAGDELLVAIAKSNASGIVWQDGSSKYERSLEDSGNYVYTLKNICGNTTDSISLAIQPLPIVDLDSPIEKCEEAVILSTQLDTSLYAFEWSTGENTAQIAVDYPNFYSVTVRDSLGCEGWGEIEVTACVLDVFIPNAFSPNNDGHNDVFVPVFPEETDLKKYHFQIFNRWGELVFESAVPHQGWDGNYQAQPAALDQYTYKLWLGIGSYEGMQKLSGKVTLVR